MHKFFVEASNVNGNYIKIEGDDVHHASKVLRLRKGDEVLISSGDLNEFLCTIEEFDKKYVLCKIEEKFENKTEAPIRITLFQGLPKSQKMDLIVQKSVEIGVFEIQPVTTKRTDVRVNDRDLTSKLDRWNKIALEAAKQSNRGIVPKVLPPITFDEAMELLKGMDFAIIPYENEANRGIRNLEFNRDSIRNVGVLIGPEGGFDQVEVEECINNDIIPVSLGPRILRTETAGFVATSFLLYELGDMGGY